MQSRRGTRHCDGEFRCNMPLIFGKAQRNDEPKPGDLPACDTSAAYGNIGGRAETIGSNGCECMIV